MKTHALLTLGSAFAAMWLGNLPAVQATPAPKGDVYPDITDISHASPSAAAFFRGYFTAKSLHDANGWLRHFHPSQIVYYDATLGFGWDTRSSLAADLTALTKTWPESAKSYPLRVLGNSASAVVVFVDTPELFGAELRIIAAFDFRNGKVTRQVDYWDGRNNSAISLRSPDDQYPHDLGLETVRETAAPEIDTAARRLNTALAAGNASAAADLFSADAIFEDTTTRAQVAGRLAIGRYLQRALSKLPYGPGVTLRHVLGSAQGGGYEWQTDGLPGNGITALELDGDGAITRLTTVWDASRVSDEEIQSLAVLSIEG